jgi:hypothetical protein
MYKSGSAERGETVIRRLWEYWKVVAHKIGNFQSRVLLTLFYFLILAPFGLGVKLFSDPLSLKRNQHSHWFQKDTPTATTWDQARRQF